MLNLNTLKTLGRESDLRQLQHHRDRVNLSQIYRLTEGVEPSSKLGVLIDIVVQRNVEELRPSPKVAMSQDELIKLFS